jgi:hypothetical protein
MSDLLDIPEVSKVTACPRRRFATGDTRARALSTHPPRFVALGVRFAG